MFKKMLWFLSIFVFFGCSSDSLDESNNENVTSIAQAVTGNINPGEIQIDGPLMGADLFANTGIPLNAGAQLDWVADMAPNNGVSCLGSDSVVSCLESGVTGASGGTGHWNGLRLVDGIASGDSNIFLSGGKENDTSSWNIGPGSVGSSKYDVTQAYLANNQQTLYFGMERRGNNGTTAFDFEFNQLAPMTGNCVQSPLVPCRSVGDVLFTFEAQGSGGSGSVTPHIYTWDGTSYVEGAAGGIVSSINTAVNTAGAPWGHVDPQGNWVLGNLNKFTFAEAAAPISLLPGVNSCGGKAFVQVRTRSSATATSDLKDTTNIFEFLFNNMTAQASLTASCDGGVYYSATAVDADGNPVANPVCSWTFSDSSTSSTCDGFLTTSGSVTGTVEVQDSQNPACESSVTTAPANGLAGLVVSLQLQSQVQTCPGMQSDAVTYNVVVSGGDGQYSYTWTDVNCSGSSCTVDPADSSMCHDQSLSVSVSDSSGLCPAASSEAEQYSKVTTVTATDN